MDLARLRGPCISSHQAIWLFSLRMFLCPESCLNWLQNGGPCTVIWNAEAGSLTLWGEMEHSCLWKQLWQHTFQKSKEGIRSLYCSRLHLPLKNSILLVAQLPFQHYGYEGRTCTFPGRVDDWPWWLPIPRVAGDRNWLFPVYLTTPHSLQLSLW